MNPMEQESKFGLFRNLSPEGRAVLIAVVCSIAGGYFVYITRRIFGGITTVTFLLSAALLLVIVFPYFYSLSRFIWRMEHERVVSGNSGMTLAREFKEARQKLMDSVARIVIDDLSQNSGYIGPPSLAHPLHLSDDAFRPILDISEKVRFVDTIVRSLTTVRNQLEYAAYALPVLIVLTFLAAVAVSELPQDAFFAASIFVFMVIVPGQMLLIILMRLRSKIRRQLRFVHSHYDEENLLDAIDKR